MPGYLFSYHYFQKAYEKDREELKQETAASEKTNGFFIHPAKK